MWGPLQSGLYPRNRASTRSSSRSDVRTHVALRTRPSLSRHFTLSLVESLLIASELPCPLLSPRAIATPPSPATPGNVKLLLPPRQSRGDSHVGLERRLTTRWSGPAHERQVLGRASVGAGRSARALGGSNQ